ncbi:MAG: hypothetical protein H6Q86_5098 [candidate division NC10 bacterium]|nr:hypothetical protein [candidate division NC10 bacterium]
MVTAAIFALLVLLMMLGVPIAASMALTSILAFLALGAPAPLVSLSSPFPFSSSRAT